MDCKFSIEITESAYNDIDKNLKYINEKLMNTKARDDLYADIQRAIGYIIDFPKAQPQTTLEIHKENYDIRKYFIGNYILYYAITNDKILILRMIYGSRNIDESYF